MKNMFLIFLVVASIGLTGCSRKPRVEVVSTSTSTTEVVEGQDMSSADRTSYADEMYAEELANRISDRVFFDLNSSSLNANALETLNSQIGWIKANSSKSIVLEGHCDERGTREYNLALGERRANAVKTYMIAQGVEPSRIKTISYGKERPAILGNNPATWAQNRRSVTIIKE